MAAIDRALDPLGLVRRSTLSTRSGGANPTRVTVRAVTAAAVKLRDAVTGRGTKKQRWQDRVFEYRKMIGEVRESAEFFGRNLGRVHLLIQELDKDGEWVEAADGPAVEALARLQGPAGNADAIKSQYGELHFLVGEGYLFGYREQGADDEVWEYLSTSEIKFERTSDGPRLKRRPRRDTKSTDEQTWPIATDLPLPEGQAIALRLWNPDPEFSDEADAPMQAVLDVCEELVALPRAVRNRARSRLSAGVLAIPDDITEQPVEGHEGMDEDPDQDVFLTNMIEAFQTAIRDEDSVAAFVPLLLRANGESLEHIKHIKFVDPAQAYPETEREVHAIRRFAQGVSLPVEVVTGVGQSNHWSAWQIDEAKWTAHLEPVCVQMVADITSAYIRPQLAPDQARRTRVWYDDAGLVTKPDRAGDAQQAHDRMVISDEALRVAMGFDEADAPDDEELLRRIGVKLGDAGLAVNGEVTGPAPAPAEDGTNPSAGPGNQGKGPPDTDDEQSAATAAAVRVAVARCRQAAGARVLTRLQREKDRPDLNGTPSESVCAALGSERITALGMRPADLVKGGASCLAAAGWGPELADLVERHAARTLFDDRPPAVHAHPG